MSPKDEIQGSKIHIFTIIRRIVQFFSFLLINYVILETIFNTKLDIVSELFQATPFINAAGNAWSNGAGFLEYTFHAISVGTFPYLFLALIGVFALLTGRFSCGWICPVGFIQDILAGLGTHHRRIPVETDKKLKKFKMFLLYLIFIILAPLGYYAANDPAQFVTYSEAIGPLSSNPAGPFSFSEFLFVTLPEFIRSIINDMNFNYLFAKEHWWRAVIFFIYIFIISMSITYPRYYCRYLCIYGAMAKIFSEYSLLKLRRLPSRCVGRKACGACEQACPMAIRILDDDYQGFTGEGECILCMKCMEACTDKGFNAIKLKFGW